MQLSMLYSSLGPLKRQKEYVDTPMRVRLAACVDGMAASGNPVATAAPAAAFLKKDLREVGMVFGDEGMKRVGVFSNI